MKILNHQTFYPERSIKLEVMDIEGDFYAKEPDVLTGTICRFSSDNDSFLVSMNQRESFSLNFLATFRVTGDFITLLQKLSRIKEKVIQNQNAICEHVDQFAYVHIFIIPHNNTFELVLATDCVNGQEYIFI